MVCAVLDNKEICRKEDVHENNIRNQLIFNNSCIKYKNSTLFFSAWQKRKIEKLRDIINTTEKRLHTLEEIQTIIEDVRPSLVFEYNAIVNAIPVSWKESLASNTHVTEESTNTQAAKFNTKPKQIKAIIEQASEITKPYACDFWRRKFNFDIGDKTWLMARNTTQEVRLLELHWKITHNIYPTNILLQKMKVTNTNKCNYCTNYVDFIEHFFCDCEYVKPLWKYIEQKITLQLQKHVTFTVTDILFGVNNNSLSKHDKRLVNHLILIGKMCISIGKKKKSKIPLHLLLEHHLHLRSQHFPISFSGLC